MATHNYHKRSIAIVIPNNHALLEFFNVVNEKLFHNTINIIFFEVYQRRARANKIERIIYLIPEIVKQKRYLKRVFNNHLAQLKGAEIYFFSRALAEATYYFLEKLSKRNKLVYIYGEDHLTRVDKHTPTSIVDLVSLIILKLVYGRNIGKIKLLTYPRGASYIPDKFIDRKVDEVIDREERNEMMKDFDLSQFKVFDVGKYSVIYVDDNLIESGYVADESTFKREITDIFEILRKYFPEREIARKYHPHFPGDKTIIKIGDVLPDFIPAQLLYNENVKMYLGACSNAIVNAEKGLAVSLLDLITLKSDDFREQLRENLIQRSRSGVLFPKSLDEFEQILIDVKGQRT